VVVVFQGAGGKSYQSTEALPRHCQSSTKGITKALPRHYQGTTKALPRHYQGTTMGASIITSTVSTAEGTHRQSTEADVNELLGVEAAMPIPNDAQDSTGIQIQHSLSYSTSATIQRNPGLL
jgi:hypothetical protein